MKKLLFILAALYCTMVASAQSTPPNNEIWYTSTDGKVVTPNKANAFNVGITSNEYKNGKGILTFAGDLTSIGDYAFTSCSSLATIAIPSSVTNFGKAAFRDCANLSLSITVGGCVGEDAFKGCTNLKSVTVKDGTSIGRYVFDGYKGELILEGCMTNVGQKGFRNCTGLTTITVGGSVGDSAFDGCTNLKSVTIKDGTSIGKRAFEGYKGEFIFEGCVTNVENYAFADRTNLTSITVCGSVGVYAFAGCTNLKSVTINDCTSIGNDAFNGCTNLTAITVGGSVGDSAFDGCTNLKSVTIKDGTSIGQSAFDGYNGEFIFEGCVTNVGNFAFADCTTLASITVSGSVGVYAFAGCTNLKSVTIMDGTSIGTYAFSGCTNLTTIIVSGSVGDRAFLGITNLKTVTIKDGTSIGAYAFDGYNGEFIFEGCVTNVGNFAFSNCPNLTFITVGGSVGDRAFEGDANLKSVTIKDGTSIIGPRSFDGYNGEFIFEGCVTNVGSFAFANCPNLTSITVGGSVEDRAFEGSANLKSVTIKDGTSIGKNAFGGYNGEFIFEGCVMDVDQWGFQNCPGLTSITVGGSAGLWAFENCTNLTSVIIKEGASIGEYAFSGCSNLTSVTIKDRASIKNDPFVGFNGEFIFEGAVYVGYSAFSNCSALKSVTVLGDIGVRAFEGCTNLESITINDYQQVGDIAFAGCTGLKSMVITSDAPPFLDGYPTIIFGGVNPDIPIYVSNVEVYSRSEWGKYFTNFIVNLISYKSQALHEIDIQKQGITLSEEEVAAIEACIKTINDIPDDANTTDERLATIKKAKYAALAIINKDKFRKEKAAATAEVTALVPKGLANDYLTEVLQEQMNAINATNTIVGLNAAKENATTVINKALAVCQAFLGTLGTKQNGHSVEVTDQNGQVIKLYNPKTVMYVKVKEDDTNAPVE